ncbi:AP2-like ethylene-responsive transcription factor ANT isoform X2 [Telopea speciosissima]|uniref:AP2-like ethylene-responsive transcription factor ANT isoform X2 n=1 Tax=Telopea speciosissima TaxID=54955 RepID=UPI001CC8087F|nr:AP2-like ethylene-responsive transcription factor ANT isoform X2 [Telopea speciosissima]
MKSMNNDNSNSNNWLGFSLSPHMNMEVRPESHHHHHHHHQNHNPSQPPAEAVSTAVPTSFLLSPPHLNSSGICYGVDGENGGFYSHLSVMPLKSDGSLCIMEALTRSHNEGLVPTSSPKLEDFLGGASMGTHQYGSNEREAIALSLDSMYYQQNPEPEANRQHFLQQPFRHPQQQQIQVQQHPYFSGLTGQEMFQTPLEEEPMKGKHLADCSLQLPPMPEDAIPSLNSWIARQYSTNQALQQKMVGHCISEDGAAGNTSVGPMGYGDLQSLSLSMSPGSQSSCVTAPQHISPTATESVAMETKKRGSGKVGQKQPVHRKSIDTFGQRTSQYRGVTRHRWTGRYEAHLWDNSCKKEGQSRKGRQVYLGGYDMEERAARAYDLAALKYWGPSTHINFPLENYQEELEEMKKMSRQEYVAHLRRKSSGFSRGASMYRGVTRHHQHGRWQARIGRVAGNKDLYLGTFSTQEEAAEAYDIAAIKFRGVNAVTNFDITRYDVERIIASNTLLAGELAKRSRDTESSVIVDHSASAQNSNAEAGVSEESKREEGCTDWRVAMYQTTTEQPAIYVELVDQKPMNYRNPSFSGVALHSLIGMDHGVNPAQGAEDSAKQGTHLSNASSLVTSLSSSREGSPDKSGLSMVFAKSTPAPKLVGPTATMNAWIPSAQLSSSIAMAHLPVFAAWTDT